jgi:GNAT superfamily N-acetyltransferase
MHVTYEWRGSFENAEVNALHAEAFEAGVHRAEDRKWNELLVTHSLGWVVVRDGHRLVGFVNVVWDGLTHAWVQDAIVADDHRNQGIGTHMLEIVCTECQSVGCAWLHADFDEDLGKFYFQSCGFTPTAAGLIRLNYE